MTDCGVLLLEIQRSSLIYLRKRNLDSLCSGGGNQEIGKGKALTIVAFMEKDLPKGGERVVPFNRRPVVGARTIRRSNDYVE